MSVLSTAVLSTLQVKTIQGLFKAYDEEFLINPKALLSKKLIRVRLIAGLEEDCLFFQGSGQVTRELLGYEQTQSSISVYDQFFAACKTGLEAMSKFYVAQQEYQNTTEKCAEILLRTKEQS